MECTYETKCVNIGYELLTYENNAEKLAAWKTGTTGFPLVDATMRCLIATGWINFRITTPTVFYTKILHIGFNLFHSY